MDYRLPTIRSSRLNKAGSPSSKPRPVIGSNTNGEKNGYSNTGQRHRCRGCACRCASYPVFYWRVMIAQTPIYSTRFTRHRTTH